MSSSWDALFDAYILSFVGSALLLTFILTFLSANCGIKVVLRRYPSGFDQFTFCFYPFLLGSPLISESHMKIPFVSLTTLFLLGQRVAKLPLPYVVSYRLFTSLVASCQRLCQTDYTKSTSSSVAIVEWYHFYTMGSFLACTFSSQTPRFYIWRPFCVYCAQQCLFGWWRSSIS